METGKIERFRLEGLRNMEFTLVVPHILTIVERSPHAQQLEKRLNGVKAFLPDLDRIEAQERRWHDARLLDESERSRDGYVSTLIRTEKTFSHVVIPGYEDASEKLTALFNKHGRDIASDRNIAETQRIYNLVEDIERTPGMKDLLNRFALMPAYESMKQANIRFDELWQQRNRELSENERVDSKLIRTNCVKALNVLYDGIDYLAAESEDRETWTQLIRELSRLSSYYRQQMKARKTRQKNKDNTADEPLIRPETAPSTEEN
ncbi:MAG: DUF6261 family protein [Tannerella sp.]|nr:DUF6261 family protein [Tannerella sp.]